MEAMEKPLIVKSNNNLFDKLMDKPFEKSNLPSEPVLCNYNNYKLEEMQTIILFFLLIFTIEELLILFIK